jgi:hypothetical protein
VTRKRRLAFIGVILAINVVVAESASYVVERVLVQKGAIYRPTIPSNPERYLAERDPVLGWPPRASFGSKHIDMSGARVLPAFPQTGNACVSAYGDSFVFADEVDDVSAWPNQLALKLGCRVANYGVNGYGTDQAYLRFTSMREDEAPVAILGYFSDDIIRNVNQLRNLVSPTADIGLKPRYIIDAAGELQLVPIGSPSPDQLPRIMASPGKFLQHEYFVPDGPSGLVSGSFPFISTTVRSLWSYKIRAVLRRESPYAAFYRENHPSQALEISRRILLMFAQEARRRGKKPLIVFFPSEDDLVASQKGAPWLYQPLLDDLRRAEQPSLNLGTTLIERLNGRHPHTLFGVVHFKAEGNLAIADAVHEALSSLRP